MTCPNCATIFTLSAPERAFHAKLNLPTPKFCFDCRMQRKMAFRNERALYTRSCDLCRQAVVSMYDEAVPFPVYCPSCWWSDRWDGRDFGQDINWTKPVFEQLTELQSNVPHMSLMDVKNNNCPYTNWVSGSSNCYLTFASDYCEDTHYSEMALTCRSCLDCTATTESEECYFCIDVHRSYAVQFSRQVYNSRDIAFSFDLVGCHDCILSYNQRHKQCLINNVQYTPERYYQERAKIFASRSSLATAWQQFLTLTAEDAIHKYANNVQSEAVEGDRLQSSTRTYNSFDSAKLEDCTNIIYGDNIKDCTDSFAIVGGSEECYEAFSHSGVRRGLFSIGTWFDSYDVQYSYNCNSSEHLFGCAGLKKARYCILNKQYSEADYKRLVEKLITHMQKTSYNHQLLGEYGEFFQTAMSPFAYNETLAYEHYPLSQAEVEERGWRWKNKLPGTYGQGMIAMNQLPESAAALPPDFVQTVLTCLQCQRNYKCIQQELDFYQRHHVPIPRHCPNCRQQQRLALRNPWKLWDRQCTCPVTTHPHHRNQSCPTKFKTTYSPNRPERVYSERCYQIEVY